MKRLALVAGALAVTATPLAARDLVRVSELPDRTILLLDRASMKPTERDGVALREAVFSIDNSRGAAAARFAAADLKIEGDCTGGQLRLVWVRAYQPDGKLVDGSPPVLPHTFAKPRGRLEERALRFLCEGT